MKWDMPPLNKVYEALGALGDSRVEIAGNTAKVYSSSRNKHYDVSYDPDNNSIASNDNGSYFVGYLGYPAIALLLAIGAVKYDPKLAEYLRGFAWKDINQKYKNDYDATDRYIDEDIKRRFGIDLDDFHTQLELILENVMKLGLDRPARKQRPPKGY